MNESIDWRRFLLWAGAVLAGLVALAMPTVAEGGTVFGLSPVVQAVMTVLVLVGLCLSLYSVLEHYTDGTSQLIADEPRVTLITGIVVSAAMWLPYGGLVLLVASFGEPGVLSLIILSVLGAPLFAIMFIALGIGLVGIGRRTAERQGSMYLVIGLIAAPIGGFPVPFAALGLFVAVLGTGAMFWDLRRGTAPLDSQDRESYAQQHRYL
jgi:hypothetical protein